MARRSRRRNRRRSRRRRRNRRGGQKMKSAKQTMTAKGRSLMGRFGSTRSGKRFGLGISKKKSKLKKPPPKGKAPPTPSKAAKAGKQAADKAANIVAASVKGAAKQVAKEARKCTGPGKCSTQKSANESRGLCFSYGKDCMWDGKKAGQKRAHATWREAAALGAERELEKDYGNNRPQTQLGNVQAKGNAAWGAAGATDAFRRSAWDARKKRENLAALDDLKPISMGSKIASSNVNTAKLAKKTGVSISQVKAGKQAANVAANIVANDTAALKPTKRTSFMCPKDVNRALKKLGICQQLGWGETCPRDCSVTAAGGSRRRYAKKKARPGPYRRRRSRRRKQRGGQPHNNLNAQERWVHGLRGGRRRRTRRR